MVIIFFLAWRSRKTDKLKRQPDNSDIGAPNLVKTITTQPSQQVMMLFYAHLTAVPSWVSYQRLILSY